MARRPVSPRRWRYQCGAGTGAARQRQPAPRSQTRSRMCSAPGPPQSRYWRARGTAGRAPAAARVPPSAAAPRRRRRTSRAGCPCWPPPDPPPAPRRGRDAACPSAGQRNVGPVEPCRPHVDAHPPIRQRLGGQVAGDGADHLDAPPGLRISRSATQRVALPQAPASPPSGLRMRMKASALDWPAPARWRSADRSPRPGAVGDRRAPRGKANGRRVVEHDEVVAEAVHLSECAMGRVYAPAGQRRKGWSHPCRGAVLPFVHAAEPIFARPYRKRDQSDLGQELSPRRACLATSDSAPSSRCCSGLSALALVASIASGAPPRNRE